MAQKAAAMGADLIVFAELALSGYPPRDFLEFDDFIDKCELSARQIADSCPNIALIVGSPVRNLSGKGKPTLQCCIVYQSIRDQRVS